MIEVAFRKLLLAAQPVADLVADRVYFNLRPQDERRPSVVLTVVSAIPGATFKGRGGYVNGRMQVNALAPTYPQAKQLAQAARDALDGYTGTQDATVICYLMSENARDIPVMPLTGSANQATFGVSVDVKFMVKE